MKEAFAAKNAESPNNKLKILILEWFVFIVAAAVLFTGYIALHIYLYRRLLLGFGLTSPRCLLFLKILLIALPLAFPLARLMARISINRVTYLVDMVGSVWMGLSLYLFLCLLIAHGIVILFRISSNFHFLTTATAVLLAMSISAYAVYEAYKPAVITKLEVKLKNLPPNFDGFKIVHISDLHGGVLAGAEYTRRTVEQVNALSPDLVVFTGDLVDEAPERVKGIFEKLRRLEAPYGILACTGNHEYYVGLREVLKKAQEVGIKFLRNEKTVIADSLIVYGIDDPDKERMGGRTFSFEEVIGKEAQSKPAILLYHRPRGLEKASSLGIDLMLCGHTHNGQLFPWRYVVKLFFPRITGAFKSGDCLMYVTQGVGFWGPPMRFLSSREIVVITLRTSS